jgi:hypothetical protein
VSSLNLKNFNRILSFPFFSQLIFSISAIHQDAKIVSSASIVQKANKSQEEDNNTIAHTTDKNGHLNVKLFANLYFRIKNDETLRYKLGKLSAVHQSEFESFLKVLSNYGGNLANSTRDISTLTTKTVLISPVNITQARTNQSTGSCSLLFRFAKEIKQNILKYY